MKTRHIGESPTKRRISEERPDFRTRAQTNPNVAGSSIVHRSSRSSDGNSKNVNSNDNHRNNLKDQRDNETSPRITRTSRSTPATGSPSVPSSSRPPPKTRLPVLTAKRRNDSSKSRTTGMKQKVGDYYKKLIIRLPYFQLQEVWDFLHPKKRRHRMSRKLKTTAGMSVDIDTNDMANLPVEMEIDKQEDDQIGVERDVKHAASSTENIVLRDDELLAPDETDEVEPSQLTKTDNLRNKPCPASMKIATLFPQQIRDKPGPASSKKPNESHELGHKPGPASRKNSTESHEQFRYKPGPSSRKNSTESQEQQRYKPGPASRKNSTESHEQFRYKPGPASRKNSTASQEQQRYKPGPASRKNSTETHELIYKPSPASRKNSTESHEQFRYKPGPASRKNSTASQEQQRYKPSPASRKNSTETHELIYKPGPASRKNLADSHKLRYKPGPASRKNSTESDELRYKPGPASRKNLAESQRRDKPGPVSTINSAVSHQQFRDRPGPSSSKNSTETHQNSTKDEQDSSSRNNSAESREKSRRVEDEVRPGPGLSFRRISKMFFQPLVESSAVSKRILDNIPKVKVNLVSLTNAQILPFQPKKDRDAVGKQNTDRELKVHLKRLNEEKSMSYKRKNREKESRRSGRPRLYSVEVVASDPTDPDYEPASDLAEGEPNRTHRHICNFCGYNANSFKNLERHMFSHTGERPYKCRVLACPEDFTCYSDKIHHERHTHRDLFRYQCEQCKIGFQTEGDHMNHTFTHPLEFDLSGSTRSDLPPPAESMPRHISLSCSHCPKLFNSSRGLTTHIRLMHQTNVTSDNGNGRGTLLFSCPVCSKHFPLRKALEVHMSTFHKTTGADAEDSSTSIRKAQTFYCTKCPKSFTLRRALEVHLLLTHDVKSNVGKVDSASSNETETPGPGTLFCSQCPRWFKLNRNLELHMSLVHNATAKSSDQVKDSFKEIGPPNMFICSHCPTVFEHKNSLEVHLFTVHKEVTMSNASNIPGQTASEVMSNREEVPGPPFQCSECTRCFPLRRGLEMHKSLKHKVIIGEKDVSFEKVWSEKVGTDKTPLGKPQACGHCSRNFFTVEELQEHVKSHVRTYGGTTAANPLPFNCFYCPARFSSMSLLQEHSRKHLDERTKTCKICGKVFASQEDLALHEVNHSREKLATCQYTKDGTTHRYLFTVHDDGPPTITPVPGTENTSGPSISSTNAKPATSTTTKVFTGPARNHFTQQPFLSQGNNSTTGTFRFDQDQAYPHSDLSGRNVQVPVQGGIIGSNRGPEDTFNSTFGNNFPVVNMQIIEAFTAAAMAGNAQQQQPRPNRPDPAPARPVWDVPVSIFMPTPPGLPRAYQAQGRRNSKGEASGQGQGQVQSVPAVTFPCPACPLKFFTQRYLDVHSAVHVKEKSFSCRHCPETFKYSSSLLLHQRLHNKDVLFACLECPAQYGTEEALALHQICHQQLPGSGTGTTSGSGTPYSANSASVPSYVSVRDDPNKLKCLYCHKPYQHATALAAHIRLHTGERPFDCDHCEMKFRSKRNLRKHVEKRHTNVQETDENYEDDNDEPMNFGEDYVNFEDEEMVGMINPESFIMLPTDNLLNLKFEGEAEEEEEMEIGFGNIGFGNEDNFDNLEVGACVPQVILETDTDDNQEETILIPELTLNDAVEEVIPQLNVTTELRDERESLVTPPPPPTDEVPNVATISTPTTPSSAETGTGVDDFIVGL